MTNREIASELGSSREVASRILKDLESTVLIQVARGAITLLVQPGLIAKSEEP